MVGTAQLAFKEVKPRTGDKIESKLAFLPRQQQHPPPRWLLATWNRLLLSTINIQQTSPPIIGKIIGIATWLQKVSTTDNHELIARDLTGV